MDERTEYSTSLGSRILGGAGALTLAPFRVDPTAIIPALAHRVDERGRLLVMCPAADAEFVGDAEVRLDGTKKAPELFIDITVASLHGLGRVTWLDAADGTSAATADATAPFGHVPESCVIGVVELDKVLLHGPCGVATLDPRAITAAATTAHRPFADHEFDARDIVGRLTPDHLSALLSDVLVERVPGFPCSEFEIRERVAAAAVQATPGFAPWIADVDPAGITLATMHHNRLTSVFVNFPEPVHTLDDLAGAVAALAARTSARHASPRI